jgi:hypothetical protein
MAKMKSAIPGDGDGVSEHFRYTPTEYGGEWFGYLAGPPWWVKAHTKGKSKCCVKWLTDGRVACSRCSQPKKPDTIAYVPIYREQDGNPILVIVWERSADALAGISHLTRVKVMRESLRGDTVCVMRALKQIDYRTTLKYRHVEVDVQPSVVKLWGQPEVFDWYRTFHGEVNDNAVSQPPAPTPDSKPPAKKPARDSRKARVVIEDDGNAPMRELFPELAAKCAERAACVEPSTNGNHKTPPKG